MVELIQRETYGKLTLEKFKKALVEQRTLNKY